MALVASISCGELSDTVAAVYEWVDGEGVVHYSNAPPAGKPATMRRLDEPCRLKEQVENRRTLEVVIALGSYLGGLDESNRALAKKRLSDTYHSLLVPLHDLEEYCKVGNQGACACLASITNNQSARGYVPRSGNPLPGQPVEAISGTKRTR
jgi:hypothetical protein